MTGGRCFFIAEIDSAQNRWRTKKTRSVKCMESWLRVCATAYRVQYYMPHAWVNRMNRACVHACVNKIFSSIFFVIGFQKFSRYDLAKKKKKEKHRPNPSSAIILSSSLICFVEVFFVCVCVCACAVLYCCDWFCVFAWYFFGVG